MGAEPRNKKPVVSIDFTITLPLLISLIFNVILSLIVVVLIFKEDFQDSLDVEVICGDEYNNRTRGLRNGTLYSEPNHDFTLDEERSMYPRKFWSLFPAVYSRNLQHPTPYVVISHSAGPFCSDPYGCKKTLRDIQAYHVDKNDQPDIDYNFMVDVVGNVYEGRGWDDANSFGGFVFGRNIAVCFLGNYVFMELSDGQKQSLKDLLELGVELGKLSKDYEIIALSQIKSTLSPGKNVLKVIDTWPHRCLSNCSILYQNISSDGTNI